MLIPGECNRILIVRLSAIGDVMMTTPVAQALRTAFPDAYIAWVVESKSKDVLVGNPFLDEVIVWQHSSGGGIGKSAGFLTSLWKLRRELRQRRFDTTIDFQGLLKSAFVARLSGARQCVGYDNAREGAERLYNSMLHIARQDARGMQLYGEMLEQLGIASGTLEMHMPLTQADRDFAHELISQDGRKTVALCPATTWPQKHWTEEGWASLADRLALEHGAQTIFMGSPADVGMIARIMTMMRTQPTIAAGKTTIKQAAAVIEQSDLVISVDTGLFHIANALNRPLVGIFGPTLWDYLGKKDTLAIVAKNLSCMPCFRRPTCKQFDCMRDITPDDVLSESGAWLAAESAAE